YGSILRTVPFVFPPITIRCALFAQSKHFLLMVSPPISSSRCPRPRPSWQHNIWGKTAEAYSDHLLRQSHSHIRCTPKCRRLIRRLHNRQQNLSTHPSTPS